MSHVAGSVILGIESLWGYIYSCKERERKGVWKCIFAAQHYLELLTKHRGFLRSNYTAPSAVMVACYCR